LCFRRVWFLFVGGGSTLSALVAYISTNCN
jgi:hypothetical protein